MESTSVVTITERDLEDHLELATAKVTAVTVRRARAGAEAPGRAASLGGRAVAYRPMLSLAGGPGAPPRARASLLEAIRAVTPRDELLSPTEHLVLRAARRGLQVGLQVHETYARASGLARLKESNRGGRLPRAQDADLASKAETAAAVAVYTAAAFFTRQLAGERAAEVEGLSLEVAPPEDLPLGGLHPALDAYVAYLEACVKAHAKDDLTLLAAALGAGRAVATRLRELEGSLGHLEFFLANHYRVEADDLVLAGFEDEPAPASSVVELPRKRPEEVVGNHVAKFEAMRLAQRLVCYDLGRRRNPFVDLGGFTFSFLGDGRPGTGKTTLIQMTVSLLQEYCEALGLPFKYRNFSVDEISDYQGRSGQNAKRFCQAVIDPAGIGFGTVDDVDQVCGSRNDRHASAGALEVTAVLMQELAGPGTIVRGNATFGLFSNYPEKVDDALRQRAQARFLVEGPRTREDLSDLLVLLLGEVAGLENGEGYTPFATQQIRKVIRARYQEFDEPKAAALRGIFEEHTRGGPIDTWIEFGAYLEALQAHDERFTGRAIKNITDAVRFRAMDFDLPEEWFEDPARFFARPYETKLAMLGELRGEVTPQMMLQEIHRYADAEARYGDAEATRALDERKQALVLDARARAEVAAEAREEGR